MDQRMTRLDDIGEFEIALARHGANRERTILLAQVRERSDLVQIDHMVGQHVTHVQHRHQRLPAGENLGVFETRQETDGVFDRSRIVIGKGRRLHLRSFYQPRGKMPANFVRMRSSSALELRTTGGKVSRRDQGIQASMTSLALRLSFSE